MTRPLRIQVISDLHLEHGTQCPSSCPRRAPWSLQYVLISPPTIPSCVRTVPCLVVCEREPRLLAPESARYRVGRPAFVQRMQTEESIELMPSLATALKEEMSTLARREVRRQTAPADKVAARTARDA